MSVGSSAVTGRRAPALGARAWLAVLLLALAGLMPRPAAAALHVVIIEGLGGEAAYADQFDEQVRALAKASRSLTEPANVRVFAGPAASRGAILAYFHALDGSLTRSDRLILYLVGHGSYDGREYRFNIPGPDLTGQDLAAVLNALPTPQQLVVATGSSSGALLDVLSRPGRLLITATRNGFEKNATRFGAALAEALGSSAADSDKNGAISAHEAFNYANRRVQDYYRAQTLLASEHAVLQGAEDARFTLATLAPTVAAGEGAGSAAGAPAALLRQRAALNARIRALEQRKGAVPAAQYSSQLEQLLLQLAQLQERIDQAARGHAGAAGNAPGSAQGGQ
jgi:hypothetical protein